jgi:cysteinyl-tRNA synthetase, unknown class
MKLIRSLSVAIALLAAFCPALAQKPWSEVASFVYQLTDYQDNKLDQIAASKFDLAVIDLARDGHDDYFTAEEIAQVRQSGKFVLAYFEIGAIEDYRPEWKLIPDDLKVGSVSGWPKEQYVRFWDERWWPVVQSRVDQALAAGFDGAYLDLVTAYEEIKIPGMQQEELASRMVALIARLSRYAKGKQAGFKVVPQNCPELYTWTPWGSKPNETYLQAIDGIGLEDVFYLPHDKPANAEWCKRNRANAVAIKKAGKLVLGVDYAETPEAIADAYAKQRALGFVPYVSVRNLNIVRPEGDLPARSRGAAVQSQPSTRAASKMAGPESLPKPGTRLGAN